MRVIMLIMVGWLGLGYGVGYYWGYSGGYTDALTQLKERLDIMDEEEIDTINQEYPKWDI